MCDTSHSLLIILIFYSLFSFSTPYSHSFIILIFYSSFICDTNHSYTNNAFRHIRIIHMRHKSFIWIIHLVPVTHSYTYESFICDTNHSYANHSFSACDSFIHIRIIHLWHKSFKCDTNHSHTNHSLSACDSFICDMTHSYVTWLIHTHTHHSYVTRIIHIWIIHLVPVTHSYVTRIIHIWIIHIWIIHIWIIHLLPVTHSYVTSLIHMCDKTHTFGGKRNLSTHPLHAYGVASISRLLKIIGLFCKRAL